MKTCIFLPNWVGDVVMATLTRERFAGISAVMLLLSAS